MDAKRVLIIDDDLFLAKILEQRLRESGFDVAYAGNGEAGLREISTKRPDAIILAVALPKKDGFEVLESLEQNALLRSIPVMMLTKAGAKEDVERCLSLGACEYFIKSQHTPEDVVRRLQKRFGLSPGFTLVELLVVLGVIVVAGAVAFWQYNGYLAKQRDVERLARLSALVSSLQAASRDGMQLVDCPSGAQIRACRICKDQLCQGTNDQSAVYRPEQDLEPAANTLANTGCAPSAAAICWWTIEQDGTSPLSLDHFRVRFFLERDAQGLVGGKTHTIDETGHLE